MGFDEGRIVLDSLDRIYYAGQVLHGKLEFDQDKVKTFRGIYVKIKGHCKVHWTTTHTRSRRHRARRMHMHNRHRTYTITHDSYEEYIDKKIYLAGSDSGEHQLQPGHHVFPFECLIPPNSPSSFEGSHGHVRYEIKVVVDRAFKFDQEKKVIIKVVSPLDLNMNPYCKKVAFHAMQEPGERLDSSVVAVIKKGPIPAHTTRNWTVEMEIPSMEVYNMDGCRFIDIHNMLQVSVETPSCHTDEDQACPIIIGSIPLIGFQDTVSNPLQNRVPSQPVITQNEQGVTSSYPQPTNQPGEGAYPYPQGSPYPANKGYPGAQQPYPGSNQLYPNSYPGANTYPNNQSGRTSPYLPANSYPAAPASTPYPGNPGVNSDASSTAPLLKTGTLGFGEQGTMNIAPLPSLPPGANIPYPTSPMNPYIGASAPAPTPDNENKALIGSNTNST